MKNCFMDHGGSQDVRSEDQVSSGSGHMIRLLQVQLPVCLHLYTYDEAFDG